MVRDANGRIQAIVSDIPGTTRDAINSKVSINGQEFILIDTAGIRKRGKIERGVEKFLWVVEGHVKVKLETQEYDLKSQETLYFDASFPHQISNEGQKTARVFIAVSPSKI